MGKRPVPLLFLLALVSCSPPANTLQVSVVADGQTIVGATQGTTVRDALTEMGILLDEDDRVEPPENSLVEGSMTIRVIRVEVESQVTTRLVAFERQTIFDATIPYGERRLLQAGKTGLEELTYRVRHEDGVQVERTLLRRATLEKARAEIVLIGGQIDHAPVVLDGTIASISAGNVWLMRATSSNRWRLTHSGDLDGRVFRLSPDGAFLLYTRATTTTVSGGSGAGLPPFNTLWLIETGPGATRPLQLAVDNVLWADWEPSCGLWNIQSGCRIAFSTGVPAAGSPGWRAENDLVITELDVATGELPREKQVIHPNSGGAYGWWGTSYSWAPDSSRLAYARADEIGAVDVPTGTLTTLASFPPYRTYASWVWVPAVSWSVDSAFVIATLHSPPQADPAPQDSPVFDVWTIAANGTLKARVAEKTGMWAAPSYSRRGDVIVYGQARTPMASATSRYDLYVMDRDGSSARSVFPPSTELGLGYPDYAWAPSGEQVVVVYRGNLYLISLTDGAVSTLSGDGSSTKVDWR